MRAWVSLLLLVGSVALVGVAISPPAKSAVEYVGYPNSMAVLGHSGATGESSDPRYPGLVLGQNSWATGTNPKVKSIYLRILALNPTIKGHNINLAQGGATVRGLVEQARTAVTQYSPPPELILIQIMDNDIVCPSRAQALGAFGTTFASALQVLARGAPDSSFFVVSQFGSPGTYARSFSVKERKNFAGTGPCDFIDSSGRIVPKKLARLEVAIHGYEAALKAQCTKVAQCRYDGGAFGAIVDRREYSAPLDPNHFSVKGHAKAAAVAWAAMVRAGLLPRS